MGKIEYTIAVAIYNVEAYLNGCLDSIVRQLDDSMQLEETEKNNASSMPKRLPRHERFEHASVLRMNLRSYF